MGKTPVWEQLGPLGPDLGPPGPDLGPPAQIWPPTAVCQAAPASRGGGATPLPTTARPSVAGDSTAVAGAGAFHRRQIEPAPTSLL
jgi:hypothetical protein